MKVHLTTTACGWRCGTRPRSLLPIHDEEIEYLQTLKMKDIKKMTNGEFMKELVEGTPNTEHSHRWWCLTAFKRVLTTTSKTKR